MTTTPTQKQINAMRRFLIANGEATAGLTAEDIAAKAEALGYGDRAPKTETAPKTKTKTKTKTETQEPEVMPTTQQTQNPTQALELMQQAMQMMQPQAPQIDEAQLVELIHKHATKTLNIQQHDKPETTTIEGAHKAFEKTLKLLTIAPLTNVWPYLRGPAGSGKTTIALQLAKALDLTPYDTASINDKFELIGFVNPNGDYQETPFYKAYKHGGVFLFDEIDGSAPEAVLAFNMALSNGHYTFPNGERVKRHDKCYFIAGGNTFGKGASEEYSARELLDGATRNRFVEVVVDYDTELENRLAHNTAKTITDDYSTSTVDKWHGLILEARQYAAENSLPVIISPRQTIQGAAMLASGFNPSDVKETILSAEFTNAQLEAIRKASKANEA